MKKCNSFYSFYILAFLIIYCQTIINVISYTKYLKEKFNTINYAKHAFLLTPIKKQSFSLINETHRGLEKPIVPVDISIYIDSQLVKKNKPYTFSMTTIGDKYNYLNPNKMAFMVNNCKLINIAKEAINFHDSQAKFKKNEAVLPKQLFFNKKNTLIYFSSSFQSGVQKNFYEKNCYHNVPPFVTPKIGLVTQTPFILLNLMLQNRLNLKNSSLHYNFHYSVDLDRLLMLRKHALEQFSLEISCSYWLLNDDYVQNKKKEKLTHMQSSMFPKGLKLSIIYLISKREGLSTTNSNGQYLQRWSLNLTISY